VFTVGVCRAHSPVDRASPRHTHRHHRLTSFSVTAVTRVVADIANQHRPAAGKRSRRSSVVDLLNASVVLDLFEGV